jgi:hypothetical protein
MIEDKKKDGWYHAGMQIAQLLSMRPEVASEGIVGAVKDILAALDKKPKARSEKYRELLSRVLELEKQNEILMSEVNKHRKRRDELIGLALLASEQSDISPKQRLNKIVTEAKRGLSARVLQNSKIAASKLNHE